MLFRSFLYIIFPLRLGSFILQKDSINIIFFPKNFAIRQVGIAVSAPVLITIEGLCQRKSHSDCTKLIVRLIGFLLGHETKNTFSFFDKSIALSLLSDTK